MARWGSEKKFDKNGDGRLSAGEWYDWYSATCGQDIEMSERRREACAVAKWSKRLDSVSITTRNDALAFLKASCAILPATQQEPLQLAWRTLLCQLSVSFQEGTRWFERQIIANTGMYTTGKAGYPYRYWASDLAVKSGLLTQKAFESEISKRQLLYEKEGALTANYCGTFWQQVIAQLPPYDETAKPSFANGILCDLTFAPDSDRAIERALEDILQSLFPLAAFFAGEMDAADRRSNRFLEYFISHWRRLRGVYVPFCDDEVEQLTEEFPQLKDVWHLEELSQMDCSELLNELYRVEPELALTIWRYLAETTEPITDPKAAEQFFYRLEIVLYDGEDDPELLRPLLDALQEEPFARQMFQSAFVNFFHANLINAALVCGNYELAEHFRDLLKANPLPTWQWEFDVEDLEKLFMPKGTLAHRNACEDVLPDDGTVFHYCTVQLQGVRRPYTYLAGDLSLKVGDWVEVPFGKDNIPRRGQIGAITACTRIAAPWPPEQTKTVLRIVEVPHKEV